MNDEGRHDLRLSHIRAVFGGLQAGRSGNGFMEMITFDDIENVVYPGWAGANRDGGGVEGGKWTILVPHMAAVVDDIGAWSERQASRNGVCTVQGANG